MFWNHNKKNKNTDDSAEEQRPLVTARTLINMGDAAGVWIKTQGDDTNKPVVLVATSERNALVETATTFMYDLKNSANEGEDVSALAWSPRSISLIAENRNGDMRVVHTASVEDGTIHNYTVTAGEDGAVMVALTVINLTATFPVEDRPEHVGVTEWMRMCARQLVRTAAGENPTAV
jgi:hypothetical protein